MHRQDNLLIGSKHVPWIEVPLFSDRDCMKLSVSKVKRIVYNGHKVGGRGGEKAQLYLESCWICIWFWLLLSLFFKKGWWCQTKSGSNSFYKNIPLKSVFSPYADISQRIIIFIVACATKEIGEVYMQATLSLDVSIDVPSCAFVASYSIRKF